MRLHVHAGNRLGQGKRRDEDAGVEGGIALLADVETKDEFPSIGEDGSERDGFRCSNKCWRGVDVSI